MPLGGRNDCGDAKYSGVQMPFASDIVYTLQERVDCGFDFVTVPLVNPACKRPAIAANEVQLPYNRQDLLLTSAQWSSQVVGRVSEWIRPDAAEEPLRASSAAALRQELEWASHLSLQASIVRLPGPDGNANSARIINQFLLGLSTMAVWVRVPLGAATESSTSEDADAEDGAGPAHADSDAWERWNELRCLCGHNARLGAVLDVPTSLPPKEEIGRWHGEPVRALALPTSAFLTNRRGYPTLSRAHQELLLGFWRQGVQVILSPDTQTSSSHPPAQQPSAPQQPQQSPAAAGAPPQPRQQQQQQQAAAGGATRVQAHANGHGPIDVVGPTGSSSSSSSMHRPAQEADQAEKPNQVLREHPLRPYAEYLAFLFRKPQGPDGQEELELGYRDYLQAPLQPLQDNLELQTYETFEKDTVKYAQYEEAVLAALLDRAPEGGDGTTLTTVLMVVGAGRGPLVRASLSAAKRAERRLRVYAVEKNPNAVVTLHNLVVTEGWEELVTVVASDMRTWSAPEKADILVSELLGSFGDNELSPECLDGAQGFLKPDGISIPSSYTSYLQPITTAKLWNDVKAYGDLEHLETPYVVKLHRFTPLAPTQPVFTFEHPNRKEPIDNSRSINLRFERPGAPAALCHGFAGYFDACLYGKVRLSTHPPSHTPDMFSWFPIYFPLKEPVACPAGQPIQAHLWRCSAHHKVWYEWALSSPAVTHIHNPNGRSYFVGL